ncbi:MupA/Atu3671 family FMN-dependent luciferase-like monooxygenase [Streptomyces sp. NPDC014684]|uniref:MupA/Atu3671 family FMN-dependent luciferase-like monooxygenase n=1 Tax=Streptomyces sp. NPDC014684 TaxID=3364880 RepID=UPI0036FC22E3
MVGVSARFPGSRDVREYWSLIKNGGVAVTHASQEQLLRHRGAAELIANSSYIPVEGLFPGAELFDAPFFGVPPREAEHMDPQMRWSLQIAWHALENAGCVPERFPGRIGVYLGSAASQYAGASVPDEERHLVPDLAASVGTDPDFVPTMVSYRLGLTGPSINVRTACSSSLVAVHFAIQSLLSGECDLALAGGVAIRGSLLPGYIHTPDSILSMSGRCLPFDDRADGTVPGNGAGMVALKRLDDALADNDRVIAVLSGSAVNNDGSQKAGFSAPSVASQTVLIRDALSFADTDPSSIGFVETHGTATSVGDPIEFAALREVFADRTGPTCALGGVKANIGHLNTASGIAGLIKAILAVNQGVVPPMAGFRSANTMLNLDDSPFHVPTASAEWKSDGQPRRAGVSSFGIGGTNAHVIVEEAPVSAPVKRIQRRNLLVVSGKTPEAAARAGSQLVDDLRRLPADSMGDAAATLAAFRSHFRYRASVIAGGPEDNVQAHTLPVCEAAETVPRVVFMFPGQGSQYVGMARELAERFPVFRTEVEQGCALLCEKTGLDIAPLLLGAPSADAEKRLRRTEVAQPALFIVMHATATLLGEFGVAPSALIGHSVGEYVAAAVAGMFSYAAALELVAKRGKLQQECPAGGMMAVWSDGQGLPPLPDGVSVAAVNSDQDIVVAGTHEAITAYGDRLSTLDIPHKLLSTSHAFHTPLIEGMLPALGEAASAVTFAEPTVPIVSTLTGQPAAPGTMSSPDYWVRQARQPVLFKDSVMAAAAGDDRCVFLEVGPGHTLSRLTESVLSTPDVALACFGDREQTAVDAFLGVLGSLWARGIQVDLARTYDDEPTARADLSGYPFETNTYWAETPSAAVPDTVSAGSATSASGRAHAHAIDWQPAALDQSKRAQTVALLADASEWRDLLLDELRRRGTRPVVLEHPEALSTLATELRADELGDGHLIVVHALAPSGPDSSPGTAADSTTSLLSTVRACAEAAIPIDLVTVTRSAFPISDGDEVSVAQSVKAGIGRVAPQEYERLVCRVVDLPGTPDPAQASALADAVVAVNSPSLLAYRTQWLAPSFRQLRDEPTERGAGSLRKGGRYLVVGGAAGAGYEVAKWLSDEYQAHLGLLEWQVPGLITGSSLSEADRGRLRRSAASVTEFSCDPRSAEELKGFVQAFTAASEPLDGVFYAARLHGEHEGVMIQDVQHDDVLAHLLQKPLGLTAVCAAVADRQPDLLVVFSSLSAWLGGIGGAAYTAANCALAALGSSATAATPAHTLVLDWDAWRLDDASDSEALADVALHRDQALAALERALGSDERRLAIAGEHFLDRYRQWVVEPNQHRQEATDALAAERGRGSSDGPVRSGESADLLSRLSEIWFEVLGVPVESPESNFFDLGGHSLSAVKMLSRVRKAFEAEVNLADFFRTPTAAGLLGLVASGGAAEPSETPTLRRVSRQSYRETATPVLETPAGEGSPAPRAHAVERPSRRTGTGSERISPLTRSLYFFPNARAESGPGQYQLLLDAARFADTAGFEALWIPERHFHSFGGSYPNPGTAASAVAAVTEHLKIRSGSVVLPLHNPVYIAEQWSMVDNLSNGRVGLSFASGWSRRDFVLAPGNFHDRRTTMYDKIDVVRRLWRGETVDLPGPEGSEQVTLYPRPVQAELPVWVTASVSADTFRRAGTIGAGLLTHLIGQELEELQERIALYRRAWREAGHDGAGHVTLMVHAFLADDIADARSAAQDAFCDYLENFADVVTLMDPTAERESLSPEDLRILSIRGFERYFARDSLMGTPETAAAFLERVAAVGVDEVAGLVDFGIEPSAVLSSLKLLAELPPVERGRDAGHAKGDVTGR